jgi:hypothetical protein
MDEPGTPPPGTRQVNRLRRLLRAWESTRSPRLRQEPQPADLGGGDWVQIEGRAWCVNGRIRTAEREGFLLAPRSPNCPPARLLAPLDGETWRLELPGTFREIDAADIVVFPTGHGDDAGRWG